MPVAGIIPISPCMLALEVAILKRVPPPTESKDEQRDVIHKHSGSRPIPTQGQGAASASFAFEDDGILSSPHKAGYPKTLFSFHDLCYTRRDEGKL